MRYVIVGNGITGVTAAHLLRQRDDNAEIVIVGAETTHHYARTALMWIYMHQLTQRDSEPFERRHWQEGRYRLIHDLAVGIDTGARRVILEQGQALPYDRLLLAVGARPNLFGWPGQELDGVCNMTSVGDLARLEAVRPRLRRAVVVGGGLIGIELVEMLLNDRVPVAYLVREPW